MKVVSPSLVTLSVTTVVPGWSRSVMAAMSAMKRLLLMGLPWWRGRASPGAEAFEWTFEWAFEWVQSLAPSRTRLAGASYSQGPTRPGAAHESVTASAACLG